MTDYLYSKLKHFTGAILALCHTDPYDLGVLPFDLDLDTRVFHSLSGFTNIWSDINSLIHISNLTSHQGVKMQLNI